MQLPRRRFINVALIAAAAFGCHAYAQTYPTKPVRLVVTFPPGGSSDVVARQIGPLLAERLGQPFVIDNKPGAGATIGAAEVARAAARRLHADAVEHRADQPVAVHARAVAVRPGEELHARRVHRFGAERVRRASVGARPRRSRSSSRGPSSRRIRFPYGSGGIGSIGHIVGELFAKEAGIKLTHVGYKGASPMHNDLLGGHDPVRDRHAAAERAVPEVGQAALARRHVDQAGDNGARRADRRSSSATRSSSPRISSAFPVRPTCRSRWSSRCTRRRCRRSTTPSS